MSSEVESAVEAILSLVDAQIEERRKTSLIVDNAVQLLQSSVKSAMFQTIVSQDACVDTLSGDLPMMPLPVLADKWCIVGSTSQDVYASFPTYSVASLTSMKSPKGTVNRSASSNVSPSLGGKSALAKPGSATSAMTANSKTTGVPRRASASGTRSSIVVENPAKEAEPKGPRVTALDPVLPPKRTEAWEGPARDAISHKIREKQIRDSALAAAAVAQERQAEDRQRIGAPKDVNALAGKQGVGHTRVSRERVLQGKLGVSLFTDMDGAVIWPSAPKLSGEKRFVSPTAKSAPLGSKSAPKSSGSRLREAPKEGDKGTSGPQSRVPIASQTKATTTKGTSSTKTSQAQIARPLVDAPSFVKSQSVQPPLKSVAVLRPGVRMSENGQSLYGGEPIKTSPISGSAVMTVADFAKQAALINPRRA